MTKRLILFVLVFLSLAFSITSWALTTEEQERQADALYMANRRLEALPLYQALADANPSRAKYHALLADCLYLAANGERDPEKFKALRVLARTAAQRAVSLGYNAGNIVDISRLDPNVTLNQGPGAELIAEGERAFAKNDLTLAFAKYKQAAEVNPKSYLAPLFAGDMAYLQGDLPTAATWFARAIAIDPNAEDAYRYWGDAILKLGKNPAEALDKYMDAIIAKPYDLKPWQALQYFAKTQKMQFSIIKIKPPAGMDNPQPGEMQVNVNSLGKDKSNGTIAWMAYGMERANFREKSFKKEFPNEQTYRRSLKEEHQALNAVATVILEGDFGKRENLDIGLQNLLALKNADMLECWIALNGADREIARDYPDYRKSHRQQLRQYIKRFVLHL
jgi:tetratricopeptide (TPR) repeat protein